MGSTGIDYVCGRMMGRYEEKEQRKPWLWTSLLANLGVLFVFKYFNFLASIGGELANLAGLPYAAPAFELLLPLGISFYTFQTMSYSIDVYEGRIQPEKHFGLFAVFVSYFPQLVAGPIERAGPLLSQLKVNQVFDYTRAVSGLQRMAWGFFKKIVIADRLAVMVGYVYDSPEEFVGMHLLIATVFFAFQVYCDFSGYTDIAIGASQVMGIKLMENFRRPYFARSVRDFWSRWHISLTTWFRDYLYIPLGGNRVVKWRWYYNILVVFVVSGLWHGASWTFVTWGALHGLYYCAGFISSKPQKELAKKLGLYAHPTLYTILQVATTFALVCFAWIFFRAQTMADALHIVTHLFHNLSESTQQLVEAWQRGSLLLGQTRKEFLLAIVFIIVLLGVHLIQARWPLRLRLAVNNPFIRWSIYSMALLVLFYFGVFQKNTFIYFQF